LIALDELDVLLFWRAEFFAAALFAIGFFKSLVLLSAISPPLNFFAAA
jgi:hypothetical protein